MKAVARLFKSERKRWSRIKGTKPARDPEYLVWIRQQACVICRIPRPSEAHHAGDHGFGRKADDHTAIPLCWHHHREGPESAHVLGRRFFQQHGLDRNALIAELRERYRAETAA